jgi:hypothetical protein
MHHKNTGRSRARKAGQWQSPLAEALESRQLMSALPTHFLQKAMPNVNVAGIEKHAHKRRHSNVAQTTIRSPDAQVPPQNPGQSVTINTQPAVVLAQPAVAPAQPAAVLAQTAKPVAQAVSLDAVATTKAALAFADPRADLNHDSVVDILDFTLVMSQWQQQAAPGELSADINGDGVVNDLDSAFISANWQLQTAPVTVAYDWHQQVINGVLNVWAPNPSDFGNTFTVTDSSALFGSDGIPQLTSVQQGGTADCYFLAAEGSLAFSDPTKIESLVHNDAGGGWSVTFNYWNAAQFSYMPLVIHTSDQLSSSLQKVTNGEVWSLVMEKAYAAFRTWNGTTAFNTMASIGWGYAGQALTDLFDPRMSMPTYFSTDQMIFDAIQQHLNAHLPVVYHTSDTATTMVPSHVYVITGVSLSPTGERMVTTYNPWGFFETRTETELLANGVNAVVFGTV